MQPINRPTDRTESALLSEPVKWTQPWCHLKHAAPSMMGMLDSCGGFLCWASVANALRTSRVRHKQTFQQSSSFQSTVYLRDNREIMDAKYPNRHIVATCLRMAVWLEKMIEFQAGYKIYMKNDRKQSTSFDFPSGVTLAPICNFPTFTISKCTRFSSPPDHLFSKLLQSLRSSVFQVFFCYPKSSNNQDLQIYKISQFIDGF